MLPSSSCDAAASKVHVRSSQVAAATATGAAFVRATNESHENSTGAFVADCDSTDRRPMAPADWSDGAASWAVTCQPGSGEYGAHAFARIVVGDVPEISARTRTGVAGTAPSAFTSCSAPSVT